MPISKMQGIVEELEHQSQQESENQRRLSLN